MMRISADPLRQFQGKSDFSLFVECNAENFSTHKYILHLPTYFQTADTGDSGICSYYIMTVWVFLISSFNAATNLASQGQVSSPPYGHKIVCTNEIKIQINCSS